MKEKTYRVPQNVWFMIKLAWTSGEKKVLVLGLLSALLAVALNLARLYISPAVLAVRAPRAAGSARAAAPHAAVVRGGTIKGECRIPHDFR